MRSIHMCSLSSGVCGNEWEKACAEVDSMTAASSPGRLQLFLIQMNCVCRLLVKCRCKLYRSPHNSTVSTISSTGISAFMFVCFSRFRFTAMKLCQTDAGALCDSKRKFLHYLWLLGSISSPFYFSLVLIRGHCFYYFSLASVHRFCHQISNNSTNFGRIKAFFSMGDYYCTGWTELLNRHTCTVPVLHGLRLVHTFPDLT